MTLQQNLAESAEPIAADALYRSCDSTQFRFETTDELDPLEQIVGQPRAVEAVRFGVDIKSEGFNIFAMGPPGTGKRSLVTEFLQRRAPDEKTPDDWCYVNNFDESHKPLALRLPAGRGRQLRDDMNQLVDDARRALATAFESDEYRQERKQIEQRMSSETEQSFEQLRDQARERGLAVVRTSMGIAFSPLKDDGEPMSPEEVQQLTDEQRQHYEQQARELEHEAQEMIDEAPRIQRRTQKKIRELDEQVARQTLRPLIRELRETYNELKGVPEYLNAVLEDMVEHSQDLLKLHHAEQQGDSQQQIAAMMQGSMDEGEPSTTLLRRYRVNLLVEHNEGEGAPIVYEDHPTYQNLVGRIEYRAQMGALLTDFNLIKAGALHRANGGYLILDAHRVLMQPQVWEGLKRAIRSQCIRIESLGEAMGMISTMQLEPQPIPMKVTVVLLGSRMLYYLLSEVDPDLAELFKIPADFDELMDRTEEDEQLYAQLIATVARKDNLKAFHRDAVARVIEHSSRMAGDTQKLSVHMRRIADLLREASYWARYNGNGSVSASDVQHAIDAQIYRADRMYERTQELIRRGTLLIDTEGAAVGQVNGLAVTPFGDHFFGKPSRITARVRMGKGEVVDIEREVALGGPIHSKGVMILAGFLSGRYASSQPLSLSASLVFEQSYSGIGGVSASSAELFALLSAIADVPIKQSIAVTGSVNQHGHIQPIGAVNEKIEGFFDVCEARGLTGEQGVIIPKSNRDNLMLRKDVIDAVKRGEFHIWSIASIDQGIELLTGMTAGEADESGEYPQETINGRIQSRLAELARQRRRYLTADTGDDS